MTSRDFCFWLQGFFEVSDCKEVSGEQLALIKQHLGLVFEHDIKMPPHSTGSTVRNLTPSTRSDGSGRRLIC